MVETAVEWRWSSAGAHCGRAAPDAMLDMERWRKRWTPAEWDRFLMEADSETEVSELRRSTHTGRPLGTADFVAALEKATLRPLAARKAGRRKKPATESSQTSFMIVA